MKLRDLLLDNLPLLLDEDNTFIGDQALDQNAPSFDVAYSRPVGTFNQETIWGSKFFGKNYDVYGILKRDKPIAWIVLEPREAGLSLFRRAWVDRQHRGREHILTLINYVTEKAKEKVLLAHDELTSTSSRRMLARWTRLSAQQRHFKMIVQRHGQPVNISVTDALRPGVNDLELLLEDEFGRQLPRYGTGYRRLAEPRWY